MPAFAQTYVVNTIAGRGKLPYGGDGQNAAKVDLFYPDRLAYDGSGNLYFAESYYNRVFRVAVNGTLSTAAGNGQTGFSGDHGLATAAALEGPEGVAVDAAGNLYIGVSGRLCKVTSDGSIRVIAGTGDSSYSGDGKPALSATFDTPVAIAVATTSSGTVIYFSDETNNVVRKIDANGIITTVAGTGSPGYSNDGQPGNTAQLDGPEGLAVDGNGNLYIADRYNNRIRKVRPDGTIATFAGTGVAGTSGDGVLATMGKLFQPGDVVADPNGNVFIADTSNGLVKQVDATGSMVTLAHMVSVGDLAYNPAPAGGLAATDFLQHVIFGVSVPVGSVSQTPLAGAIHTAAVVGDNGPATGALFLDPYGVAVDGKGNVYVADFADQRVRRIGTDSTITTVAGTGIFGNSNNGGAATAAQIAQPQGIAVDASGNVYFTASCEVRMIQSNGNIASVAGNGGNCGYGGNNGAASLAQLYFPAGLALDGNGNLYISDTNNNRIRRVNLASTTIVTVAGSGQQGYAGNGTDALSASMDTPVGIAVDSKGNVYFADQNNHRVRKIGTDGKIYDVAGTGKAGNDGDGGPATAATLAWPAGLAVDSADNLYVASWPYIRRISAADGRIATIAGTGQTDFSGDGDLATLADMDPFYLAVDGSGRIYFSDENNLRIRRLDPAQIFPSGVVNGATFQKGPVAPGEVIVIFGSGLGPTQLALASLDPSGPPAATNLAGVQITFDGTAAPLLYVSATQASAIVPFAVAGKSSTVMQVAYQSKTTNAITMAVSPASPGVFTVAQNGSGQGCILNQDYSLNSAANPAAHGDTVMIWGTGGGQTVPASADGKFTIGTYPIIPPPVTATIGGVDAPVSWAGDAPGMVAGINQFNVQIPSGAPSGNSVPIILKVGSVASLGTVTLAVK